MHSPETVAFEIPNIFVRKDKSGYRPSLFTIWHNDPEKDGTDDSCGWFIRKRHVDKVLYEKVLREFRFQFQHNYWFNEAGYPKFSTMGVVLDMYMRASWQIEMHREGDRPTNRARKRMKRFMNRHLFEILNFSENSFDSLHTSVNKVYGDERLEDRIEYFTSVIVTDILRKKRKWYQHPRWHIHHWSIQCPFWQQLRRRYWERCDSCNKRFKGASVYSDWDGTRKYCWECEQKGMKTPEKQQ